MTIMEAIEAIDSLRKGNTYSDKEKILWLSALDGMIKREIIDTHEGGDGVTFDGYAETTPTDTVLLVPEPYAALYIRWLESKIDYANAEYDLYNNTITAFYDAYKQYSNYYNRTHRPKSTRITYF